MGFHVCEYCEAEDKSPETSSGDVTLVFASGGHWVMPDMAPHYVEEHGWQPPQAFVNDVMTSELVGGDRRQTRSMPTAVGYLAGKYNKGTVPDGFVDKLRSLMSKAAGEGHRAQTKSLDNLR